MQSPMDSELDSAARDGNLGQTFVPHYLHATGLPSAGPSHHDPQHSPSYSTSQHIELHRPPQNGAFDRFYSLVEVCAAAGSPLTSLNSPPPYDQSPAANLPYRLEPSLSPMVRAPPSDGEDEYGPVSPPNTDSTAQCRNRKRHACKMCDKAFDRPSTLKTHLLVHTGITPFSCHLCGRRFGVQSNCNRHIRRCTLRSELFDARRLEFESSQPGNSPSNTTHVQRTTHESLSPFESRSPSPPKPKRARRKRSPATTWIPDSLASFKLPSSHAPAPVPLPPVRPRTAQEERDSYIVCHDQPYTEEGWSGRLPGPAPLYSSIPKNLSNLRRRNTSMV